jgi:hypothetical protein
LVYAASSAVDRRLQWWRAEDDEPRATFVARFRAPLERPFVNANRHLLLAAIELRDRELAFEISRLRATGLMLRCVGLPLGLGALVALVEIGTGGRPWAAAASAVVLLVIAAGSLWQGRTLLKWAGMKTLEICYWLPDLDDQL